MLHQLLTEHEHFRGVYWLHSDDFNSVSLLVRDAGTEAQVPLHNSIISNFRDAEERWNDGGIAPLPFQKGANGGGGAFS